MLYILETDDIKLNNVIAEAYIYSFLVCDAVW
jgi:hypothetical protein